MPKPVRLEDIHVIGADPGKITGLARLYHGVLTTRAVPALDTEAAVSAWLAEDPHAVIGCERYVITQRTARLTAQPDAIRVTGVLHSLAESHPDVTVIDQNMSDAKRLISASLRRSLGWQQTGLYAIHRNDAVCQVGKVLASRYRAAFLELVSPHVQ